MILEFEKLKNEIIESLNKEQSIVLATSLADKVTARSISHVNDGLVICFQTSKDSEKAKQIEQNANIAIAASNIQIEAKAELCGCTTETQNKDFIEKFKNKYPEYHKMYSNLPDEVVFKAQPLKIKVYKYLDGVPTIIVLNVTESSVHLGQ